MAFQCIPRHRLRLETIGFLLWRCSSSKILSTTYTDAVAHNNTGSVQHLVRPACATSDASGRPWKEISPGIPLLLPSVQVGFIDLLAASPSLSINGCSRPQFSSFTALNMSFSSNLASSSTTPAATPLTSFSESLTLSEPLPEPDRFNLQRYIDAQDENGIFERIIQSIRDGGKLPRPTIAWIWSFFPQMDYCKTRRRPSRIVRHNRDVWPRGHSLTSLDEARAILRHPILGPRMQSMAHALLNTRHSNIFCVMDHQLLDVQRVQSTLTIFREASRRPVCMHETAEQGKMKMEFRKALDKHFSHNTDSEDEMTWGESLRPPHKQSARHIPTIQELEIRDVEAVEKRQASKSVLCICSNSKEDLTRLDEEYMKKVQEKRRKRIHRG